MVLALLLARRGISVRLLEAHLDFDREFRGDTVHPSTLEILDSLGLADRLLSLPHSVVRRMAIQTEHDAFTVADFSRLKSKFPFVALIPQVKFLDFLASEAKRLPAFSLAMGANVKELVREEGRVRGVRYQSHEGWGEVRAELTVACDGRFSRVRELAGAIPVKSAPPMDVLWFRLPRLEGDTEPGQAAIRIQPGKLLIRLDRGDEWQVGFVISKGGYHDLRSRGLPALKQSIAELVPEFAGRLGVLHDWSQIAPLVVESSILKRWYEPGLLFLGDAAHVMSPVGGLGINYAIQDAVVAANILARPLADGTVDTRHLAAIQRKRYWPTRLIQFVQAQIQNQMIGRALDSGRPFRPPAILKLPGFRSFLTRLIAYGPARVKVD